MGVGVHAHELAFRSWFSPSTVWVPGIKLKSSGLVASTFTFRTLNVLSWSIFCYCNNIMTDLERIKGYAFYVLKAERSETGGCIWWGLLGWQQLYRVPRWHWASYGQTKCPSLALSSYIKLMDRVLPSWPHLILIAFQKPDPLPPHHSQMKSSSS